MTLTLNGTFSTVNGDFSSIPLQSMITLLNAATLRQITRTNQPNFSGPRVLRPLNPYVGQQFFDTSLLPPIPIWWDGSQWIDANGTGV
jgi:hypothetical protein